jgi:hypothetical protein
LNSGHAHCMSNGQAVMVATDGHLLAKLASTKEFVPSPEFSACAPPNQKTCFLSKPQNSTVGTSSYICYPLSPSVYYCLIVSTQISSLHNALVLEV